MRRYYSYQKVAAFYKRFQFHVSGFVLAVLGVWLGWKISMKPYVPDWLLIILAIWALVLIAELIRFRIIFKQRIRRDKD
jgi:membrane protein DedA with SNARE-associated domain